MTYTWRVWYDYRIYQRWENIVAESLSILSLNGNQETTQNYTYQKWIISEINDIEELPECNFLINLKLIQKYQWTEPSIKAKYKYGTYHKGSFSGFSNTDLKLIRCKNKNVFRQNSKVMYTIGTICISFIQEWIERRQ